MKTLAKIILALALIAFLAMPCYAADEDLTDQAADTTPTTDDLIYTVNDPAGTAADRKVTIGNLFKAATDLGADGLLETDSVSANELNATGVEAELEAVMDLQDIQGAVIDAQVPDDITIDLSTVATTANAGDAAIDFFGAGVDAVTDTTTCTDLEGTALSITTGVLNVTEADPTVDTDDKIIAIINASPSTQIKHEAGGLEADVNAYSGLVGINATATSEVDTEGELETHLGGLDVVTVTADDITSANLATLLSDETGTGANVHADSPTFTTAITATDLIKDNHPDWGSGAGQIDQTDIPHGARLYFFTTTIYDPDTIQGDTDTLMIFPIEAEAFPNGVTFVDLGIKTGGDTSYSVVFEEWTDPQTHANDLETVATSTSDEAEDDGTIGNGSGGNPGDCDAGSILKIDLPATDITELEVWGTFKINDS